MGWRTVALALDLGTAVCAAINSAYFCDRLLYGDDRRARRLAVGVLGLISLGTLIEALTLLAVSRGPADPNLTASLSWSVVRLLPFAGALGLSSLIARGAVLK